MLWENVRKRFGAVDCDGILSYCCSFYDSKTSCPCPSCCFWSWYRFIFSDLKTSSIPLSTKRLQKGQANFSCWAPKLLRRGVVEHHYTLPCDGPPKILHVTSFEKKRSNHAVLCCPGENWPVSKGMKKHRPWKWWDFLVMKHFESMKYMEESLNTRQNHYMKHSIVIFFSVFFWGTTPLRKRVGEFLGFLTWHRKVWFQGIFLGWSVSEISPKHRRCFGCVFFHQVWFFPSPPEKNTPPPRCFQHCLPWKKRKHFSLSHFFCIGWVPPHVCFFSRCLTVNLHFWPQKFEFREGENPQPR